MTRFLPDPGLPDNTVAAFEKAAILGFLGRTVPRFGSRLLNRIVKPALNRVTPTAFSRTVQPAAIGLERGMGALARRTLSPERAKTFERVMRGVPRNTAREIASNALIGGLFEGGIGAAMADQGQGTDAFVHGLGSGAASGAAFGAISGTLGGMTRNVRGINMSELAKKHEMSRPDMAKKVKAMGTWDAIKGSFGKTDNLERQIARHKTLGGASQIGAEMALPMMMLPSGPEAPPPPPQAPDLPKFEPNKPTVYSPPQNFKGGSVNYRLKPIDLTKLPSYHT